MKFHPIALALTSLLLFTSGTRFATAGPGAPLEISVDRVGVNILVEWPAAAVEAGYVLEGVDALANLRGTVFPGW